MKIKSRAQKTLSELKNLWQKPHALSPLVDELSPWLNRQFLSYVSELNSPYKLGMGLQITTLEDDRVEVTLPSRLRTQNEDKCIHTGVLIALAEHTAELFWTRHLDERFSQLRLTHLEAQFLSPAQGELRARVQMSEGEREQALFEMRSQGEAESLLTVRLLNGRDAQVAEVQTRWRLLHQPALGSGQR